MSSVLAQTLWCLSCKLPKEALYSRREGLNMYVSPREPSLRLTPLSAPPPPPPPPYLRHQRYLVGDEGSVDD
ncbi:hypothetical protein HanRHA438_Chr17g0804421 [Helianthus annuus]|nr:hypothetical protein HanHA300_Chr17g0647441 [Helianthus annuus]KAJ0432668.1 hypothetical protein HanIR_Chr17g0861781 [Helianthus annuus]KAJ0446894.1 hypothetical protein HanHA89_Chr17g0699331 [Helianthus annuus]KAJ0631788.1 hypothetical protein HanLR1_Chr17g0657881 [Helianthus annuus]KAJ0635696.1 hypothetical protein HanOQP8_Chr17g0653731 [Helianthus annuus]